MKDSREFRKDPHMSRQRSKGNSVVNRYFLYQMCWNNWISISRKLDFKAHSTTYSKVNSKQILGLEVKLKTI